MRISDWSSDVCSSDLMGPRVGDTARIRDIRIATSHHTHFVIGTGAGDPQKMDPQASRATPDHSIMYIFPVALQDGGWHHAHSSAPERARRPATVALRPQDRTVADPARTGRSHPTVDTWPLCRERRGEAW